ncbi:MULTISPECIES: hypothetical protein [Rhodanobacteraceae]|uniref:hypothetical protein n=1 Tax=Rhodanobacteraceae TaxID=1775411 RepID=UPI0008883CA4|nr:MULTISPECIES: hypothetical protein [Rhodanobacteraceae]SDH01007.1 hypothetical protein SAMN04515659_3954 [Dyella sp. 333MFSha]SKB96094.1 hypothetical protein SAMN05660880_03454 [Luteibacter sp. 22Crub2.1]
MGSYAGERYWPNLAYVRSSLRLTFNGGSLSIMKTHISEPKAVYCILTVDYNLAFRK